MPDFPGTLKPPRLPSAPGSPVVGQIYYDTTQSKLLYWNGTAWVDTSATGASLITGSGVPAAGTGNNGDYYINVAAGVLEFYGPKAAGAWPGTPFGKLLPVTPTYDQIRQ